MTGKPARLSDERLDLLRRTCAAFRASGSGTYMPPVVTITCDDHEALLAEVRAGRELRRKLEIWAESTRHAGEIAADPDACDVADASPQYRSGKAVAYLSDAEEIEALLAYHKETDHG